jgi:hypothetical protein
MMVLHRDGNPHSGVCHQRFLFENLAECVGSAVFVGMDVPGPMLPCLMMDATVQGSTLDGVSACVAANTKVDELKARILQARREFKLSMKQLDMRPAPKAAGTNRQRKSIGGQARIADDEDFRCLCRC